jgi:hypothetical protein
MTQVDTSAGKPSGLEKARTQFRKVILIAILVPLIVMVIIVILAVVAALIDVQGAAEAVRIVRDLLLIFIALELGLIFLSVVVLLVQVARLLNLLTEELQPLLETTQETAQTAQNTVEFAGRNVLTPAIELAGSAAAFSVIFGSLFGLRRAYSRATKPKREEHA